MNKILDSNIEYDLNKDGTLSQEEVTKSTDLLELELREQKALTQKRISWIALYSIIVATAVLLSPMITDSRVEALGPLLSMFYLAQASVIGFYFGATAYMSK